jgi:hypothetical protein
MRSHFDRNALVVELWPRGATGGRIKPISVHIYIVLYRILSRIVGDLISYRGGYKDRPNRLSRPPRVHRAGLSCIIATLGLPSVPASAHFFRGVLILSPAEFTTTRYRASTVYKFEDLWLILGLNGGIWPVSPGKKEHWYLPALVAPSHCLFWWWQSLHKIGTCS